jgi:hypothetical protein
MADSFGHERGTASLPNYQVGNERRALCPDDRVRGDPLLGAAVRSVPDHDQQVDQKPAMAADPGVLAAAAADRACAGSEFFRSAHEAVELPISCTFEESTKLGWRIY